MSLTIVIVNYRTADLVEQCLRSRRDEVAGRERLRRGRRRRCCRCGRLDRGVLAVSARDRERRDDDQRHR